MYSSYVCTYVYMYMHACMYIYVCIYVTRFAKTRLVRTKWQGTLFTTNQLLHQWTNLPMIHCLLFLGLFSRACLTCSSAQVIFKWQWCEWTGIHPIGNRHTTGQKAWLSNWLLFVISRAQIGLRWDLLACQLQQMEKPTTPDLHPYMIICDSGINLSKMVGNSASCPL